MAIPTVLRKADFPTIDFTNENPAASFMEALRSALTTFGWNQEFNDVGTNQVVFSNAGSGYMIKFSEHSDNDYVLIETAQSWSDIDTPVNSLFSQFYYVADAGRTTGDLVFVGDNSRFYFITMLDVSVDSGRTRIFFAGDIAPFKTTDPYTFIAIGHDKSPVSTVATNSPSLSGLVISPLSHVSSITSVTSKYTFYGDAQGVLGQVDGSIISPGVPYELHRNIVPAQVLSEQPTILVPSYCINSQINTNINGTQYANFVRGILPGLHITLFPSRIITEAEYLTTVTIGGVECLTVGTSNSEKSPFLIALNDWDNLL